MTADNLPNRLARIHVYLDDRPATSWHPSLRGLSSPEWNEAEAALERAWKLGLNRVRTAYVRSGEFTEIQRDGSSFKMAALLAMPGLMRPLAYHIRMHTRQALGPEIASVTPFSISIQMRPGHHGPWRLDDTVERTLTDTHPAEIFKLG